MNENKKTIDTKESIDSYEFRVLLTDVCAAYNSGLSVYKREGDFIRYINKWRDAQLAHLGQPTASSVSEADERALFSAIQSAILEASGETPTIEVTQAAVRATLAHSASSATADPVQIVREAVRQLAESPRRAGSSYVEGMVVGANMCLVRLERMLASPTATPASAQPVAAAPEGFEAALGQWMEARDYWQSDDNDHVKQAWAALLKFAAAPAAPVAQADSIEQMRANFEDWYLSHVEGADLASTDCAKAWAAWLAGSAGTYKAPSDWKIAPQPWGMLTPEPVAQAEANAGELDEESIKPLLKFWFGLEDCKGLFNPERLLALANDAIGKAPATSAPVAHAVQAAPQGAEGEKLSTTAMINAGKRAYHDHYWPNIGMAEHTWDSPSSSLLLKIYKAMSEQDNN